MGETLGINRKAVKGKPGIERIIGRYSSGIKGPGLIITADTLGNGASGMQAFLNVVDALTKSDLAIKGELIGLAGNIGSSGNDLLRDLERKRSFFSQTDTFNLEENHGYNQAGEFVEMIEEFERARHAMGTGLFYMDIKTCPSLSRPYVCTNWDLPSIRFAQKLPLYIIKGLENFITDHMGFYLRAKGHPGCTVKTGPSDSYTSGQIQEAAIWLALVNTGCLEKEEVPGYQLHHKTLSDSKGNKEDTSFEVIYRYRIQEDEFFRMIPGYVNFQKIKEGETLATSDGGPVVSQWDGRIFMPLYHTYSRDGFFILKEVD